MGRHDHESDPDAGRDPLVARALGAVPVPARPADFFDRLDEALDAVDAERQPAAAAGTGPDPLTVHRVPERGAIVPTDLTDPETTRDMAVGDLDTRRRHKMARRYRLLAAAASVAVVIGGVAVLAGDDDPTTTVTPAGGGDPSAPAVEPTARQHGLAGAYDAVIAWSKAVSDNDADLAWELMGPGSQAYLTAQGGWEDMMAAMQEGSHAAWQRAGLPTPSSGSSSASAGADPDAERTGLAGRNENGVITVTSVPGDGDAAVVVLSAELELEGMRELVTDAYPLARDAEDRWRIEPFAFGPGDTDAEFVVPGLADGGGLEDLRPDDTFEVAAPDGEVFIAFNLPLELQPMEQQARGRWTHTPGPQFRNGDQEVLVVTRGDDWFTAHPARFFVAEAAPAACENIGFTPNTEDLASEIRATATDCAQAEALVRHVHSEMRHDFYNGPRRFEAQGFSCTVVTEEENIPVGHYRCIDEAVRVTWDKT